MPILNKEDFNNLKEKNIKDKFDNLEGYLVESCLFDALELEPNPDYGKEGLNMDNLIGVNIWSDGKTAKLIKKGE